MKIPHLLSALAIALQMYAVTGHAAEHSSTPESFAAEVVKAIRSKDPERRISVLHSKSRACINNTTRPYFDWIFSRQFQYQLPDKYKVSISPLTGAGAPLPDKSTYPVTPTHLIQLDFTTSPTSSTSIVLLAGRDAGRWYEILPCPTDDTVEGAQRSSTERDRQNRRIMELKANLSSVLRAELIELVKAGRRIDAIRKYSAATGEELAIAKGVVELLVKEK